MDPTILEQLRDLHEPLPPGPWPPSIGWWVLLALLITLIAFGINQWLRYRQRVLPYRIAILEAAELESLLRSDRTNPKHYINAVNALLKRLIVHIEHSVDAPRLHGEAWLHFLAERFQEPRFSDTPACALGLQRYTKESLNINELPPLIKNTLKKAYKTRPKYTDPKLPIYKDEH